MKLNQGERKNEITAAQATIDQVQKAVISQLILINPTDGAPSQETDYAQQS